MKRSKFYTLLRSLSEEELKGFSIYLDKNRKDVGIAFSIFEHIHSFAPHYEAQQELDRDYLVEKYFKIKPDASSRKRFYNELSKLSRELKDFLIWEKIKNQYYEKNMILAQILKEKNLRKESEVALFKAEKALSDRSKDNMSAHNSIFYFLKSLIFHHFKYYSTESLKLTSDPEDIKSTMRYLDLFYLSSKLKYSCEIVNRNKIKKEETQMFLIDEAIQLLTNNSELNTPIGEVYLQSYRLTSSPSTEQFKNLYLYIKEQSDKVNDTDKKIIFTYLINFCASRIRAGDNGYLKQAFEIYEYLEKEKLLLDHGVISSTRFNNFIDVACKVKDFNRAQQFIESNAKFLDPPIKEETIRISKALIYFEKEAYSEVLVLLREGSFKNIDHALRSRWLIICCFCALEENDSLIAACNATRQYLKRLKGINKNTLKGTQHLITMTKQISKYRYQKKKKKEQLMKKLNELNPIIFKTWLKALINKI